eukprot:TRINITY_DN781_c0_g1_i4.p1 TRINITY_DN781_c0_g1~~TRINITY_DN781_c0_g1_i4.p1  ORF type:complete len:280 (+),score=63.97 TRINITY_DN781_c0_g1_i4:95-934(+)
MSEEVGHFFKAAEEIALKAGEYVAQKWHQPRNVNEKSSNVDLVTEVDVAVEKQIITHLSSLFPTHKFIGEESCNGHEEPQTDDPTWIIDPIDGTTNFVYSFPFIAICIGLAINKKVVAGIVYNPILKEKFTAIRGKGAFLNDVPIKIPTTTSLSQSVISTNVGYTRGQQGVDFTILNLQNILINKVVGVKITGSAACGLCDVAAGRSHAYYEWGIHSWDVAAASIIVEEAGGVCISPKDLSDGEQGELDLKSRSIVCGSKEVVGELNKVLAKHWSSSWK